MSKYYSLEEVKSIRNEISKLGERKFDELEAERDRAEAEYDRAEEVHYGAEGEYNRAELDKIEAEREKAGAERNRVGAEYDKAEAEWDIKLFTLLTSICPEAYYRDWRGYLVIPKSKEDDWIIPVLAGEYKDIEHTAFSVWTMPKGSCDEGDAREVKDA